MKKNLFNSSNSSSYLTAFYGLVILFFFVGFLTTINAQLNEPLKKVFLEGISFENAFGTLSVFMWFLAYPAVGWIGSRWVDRYGSKGTLIRGLLIMIIGLCISALSSTEFLLEKVSISALGIEIPKGFFVFLLGTFTIGSSASILQVILNPYLRACEIEGTSATQRLNIGGTFNSAATVIAPFFVSAIMFGGLSMEQVKVSQLLTPFLCLAGVIALLAFIASKLSLPDIENTRDTGEKLEKSVWSFTHFTLGVVSIACYVGAEVSVGSNINSFVVEKFNFAANKTLLGMAVPFFVATLYWGGMFVGRLVSSTLLKAVLPKMQLAVAASFAIIFILLAIILNNPWLLVVVGLVHAPMWGSIFVLSTEGLGKYLNKAGGMFMIGVVGGAILPTLQGGMADAWGHQWRWTWFIVIAAEIYILYYALIGSKRKPTDE